jgi:inward rectifier potassium channel
MADQRDSGIDIINAPPQLLGFGDLYHHMLRGSWLGTIAAIVLLFIVVNATFALAFTVSGGIANARPHNFEDAFFFSVQTLGTIGYGAMYPTTQAAEILVTFESIAALLVSAISTGMIFAKFSVPRAKLSFSREAAIYLMDGQPTLAFRIANERKNFVLEAQIKVSFMHLEKTPEGLSNYRMYDLALVRERSPALGRSWTVLHKIDAKSPFFNATVDSLKKEEAELIASVLGMDSTSGQTIHAQYRYDWETLRFGKRHMDLLSEKPDGRLQMDYAKFHHLVDAKL